MPSRPPPPYPLDLFDFSTSVEDRDLTEASSKFEDLLFDNRDNANAILEGLASQERPEILRFVLSWIDENWVMNRFPDTPTEFNSSYAYRILSELSEYFLFTPTTVIDGKDDDRPVNERRDRRRAELRQLVKDAPETLAALIPRIAYSEPEPGPNVKMSQKQMKQARRAAAKANAPLDPGPFERLDIPVPETQEEAQLAANCILDSQRDILELYLKALHDPELQASIQAACLLKEPVPPPQAEHQEVVDTEQPAKTSQAAPADSETAYPTSQVMKFARLYCDSATGFGEWGISITPRGERDLRDFRRRDSKVFRIILKKIKELSNGHFSPDNQKRLNGHHVEIPIYEAKMTGDLRLVYQIDCVPTYDSICERQAIKIFGVYTHAQIGRVSFWDTMGRELGKKGKEYKDRCAFRAAPHHLRDHVFSPGTFPAPAEVRALPTGCAPDLPPDDLEQMQALLLKSVHFSQPLLHSIIEELDVAFVLQVSPQEQEIIEHPHSSYVLGRSGTGKTTTMLYKILLVEADYERSKEEIPATSEVAVLPKRRQLFVTQSRILAEKVEEHFDKLASGYRPVAKNANADPASKAAKAKTATAALVDIEDEVWRTDLPARYSELRDKHFPLFLTFDRLCGMLENDMAAESSPDLVVPLEASTSRGGRRLKLTYDRFLHYWGHFPQNLTKGLDSSMVFSEFMGVIMGSEETLTSDSTYLDRAAYENLSERAQSTFAGRRSQIYTLFESYLSLKRQLGDTDAADRTHAILRYLHRRGGVPGRKMDFIYVDEVQDLMLIDSLVLRSICHNPNGLFWAGDTAQTISLGSSFRFNELKAFQFRVEQRRIETTKPSESHHQPAWLPKTFQLTVNYRSHAGIVNCAHTIIEVITRFWPNTIDVLDRERGTVDGLRPVFFTGFDEFEQFLFGDREGSYIEFGAQQCILVRDDRARDKLREQVGDIGLIMTLTESKGLEFNDVLLYNFFEDSIVGEAQWRVVLNVLDEKQGSVPAPLFNEVRHAGVCIELKFLYVAITRARNNVWLADTSAKGEPMRMLWTSRDQIQNCKPGTDTPRLAMSSTAAEWEEQGRRLFANQRYQHSKHCFERASLPRQAAMAGAYYLRQEARKKPGGTSRQTIEARKTAFLTAAAAFTDCAREDQTITYFRIAAECFEEAREDLKAAQTYKEAKEYTRSTELYRKLGHFEEAVDLLKHHREEIRPEVVTNVTNVARLYYFNEQKLEKANALFASYEEALEYLEERGLDMAHAMLLESLGRFSEAAEVHLEEGRTFDAIRLFLQDRDNEDSMHQGIQCILQCLWQRLSFAVLPPRDDSSVSLLLKFVAKADISIVSENDRKELSMFQAIQERDLSKLESLGVIFESENQAAALLCLDHCFNSPPRIQALTVEGVAQKLEVFGVFVRLLNGFTWADPCVLPVVAKLFGFVHQGDNNFLVLEGTFLHSALLQQNHPACQLTEESAVLTGPDLRDVFQRALKTRLRQRVEQEHETCKKTRAFSPCLLHSVFDYCRRNDCPDEHISGQMITAQHYNLRVRIHLQQILIFKSVQFVLNDTNLRRYWISRLYAALYPSFYRLGSASSLDLGSIPEAEAAFRVVKEWVRSWCYDLSFVPENEFLSNLLKVARLSFELDPKNAMSYLMQSSFMRSKPAIYKRRGDNYVVGELLQSLELKEQASISAGVLFVQHIVQSQLPIHISVLCDIMEHLCACIIVADRRQRGFLHDITLPLSWVMNWSNVAGEGAPPDTHTFRILGSSLTAVLNRLHSGMDTQHLLFENKNLATLGLGIRDVFLYRICRCLCLLGYNASRGFTFRDSIVYDIRAIRTAHPDPPHFRLSHRYMTAESWTNLVRSLRVSTAGSPLDELVVILSAERPRPRPVSHVRQIVYKAVEELPQLLGSSRTLGENALGIEGDRDEAVAFAEGEEGGGDEEVEPVFVDGQADDGEPAAEPGPVAILPELEARKYSSEETDAAVIVQRAFRRVHKRDVKRKTEMAKSSFVAGVADTFLACLREARSTEMDTTEPGPVRQYRLRFLGPLPHLLFCLDVAHTVAMKQKKIIKKDLREAKHERLEALDQQLTQLTDTLKQVVKMQKTLGPTAPMHLSRDLEALRSHVSKAVELLRSLPFKKPEGLDQHIERSYKGLVQPRVLVQPMAQRRPVLNTEDEFAI